MNTLPNMAPNVQHLCSRNSPVADYLLSLIFFYHPTPVPMTLGVFGRLWSNQISFVCCHVFRCLSWEFSNVGKEDDWSMLCTWLTALCKRSFYWKLLNLGTKKRAQSVRQNAHSCLWCNNVLGTRVIQTILQMRNQSTISIGNFSRVVFFFGGEGERKLTIFRYRFLSVACFGAWVEFYDIRLVASVLWDSMSVHFRSSRYFHKYLIPFSTNLTGNFTVSLSYWHRYSLHNLCNTYFLHLGLVSNVLSPSSHEDFVF